MKYIILSRMIDALLKDNQPVYGLDGRFTQSWLGLQGLNRQ